MTPDHNPEEPLLEEEESSVVKWYVTTAMDRDCYNLYILRYSMRNNNVITSWYYQPPNDHYSAGWIEYSELAPIEPAYRFPGEILHIFSHHEWLDRFHVETALRDIATDVFAAELARGTTVEGD